MNLDILTFNQRREQLLDSLHQVQTVLEGWVAQKDKLTGQIYRNIEDQVRNFEVHYLEYREMVSLLPREIRKLPAMRHLMREAKRSRRVVHRILPSLQHSYWTEARTYAAKYGEILKAQTQRLANYLADRDTLSLMERFLKGEMILGRQHVIQWGRKVFHAGMGIFSLFLYGWALPYVPCMIFFSVVYWLAMGVETYRHINPKFNEWIYSKGFKKIIREKEINKISSATYYMTAMYIVAWVFPKPVVVLTFMFIALGDPVASIVGTWWGRIKLAEHVSLEGTLACFLTCFLSCLIFTPMLVPGFAITSLLLFSILGGLVGALAEASFPKLDDNLIMPLISAPLLWGLLKFFS